VDAELPPLEATFDTEADFEQFLAGPPVLEVGQVWPVTNANLAALADGVGMATVEAIDADTRTIRFRYLE